MGPLRHSAARRMSARGEQSTVRPSSGRGHHTLAARYSASAMRSKPRGDCLPAAGGSVMSSPGTASASVPGRLATTRAGSREVSTMRQAVRLLALLILGMALALGTVAVAGAAPLGEARALGPAA